MLTLDEWAERHQPWRRPWLLVGKGPTFDRLAQVDRSAYDVCSLNHVVRELEVTLAHAIDLDVVLECGAAIERNARYLVMPFRPHVRFDPGPKTVFDLQDEVPTLGRMARAGRLVYYDLSSSPPSGASPTIRAGHFSAESALELLAVAGAREVRSLGVDGGTAYSGAFDDLSVRTRLANARPSFDSQFDGIAAVLRRRRDVVYAPWDVEAPVRVFVGADPALRLPRRVLEWSLERHASASVVVDTVDDVGLPVPARPEHRARAGSAFGRFRIPARCGHAGRALYLEADMLALADVARPWATPLGEAALAYAPQPPGREPAGHGVLLLDCARLRWDAAELVRGLDRGEYSYEALVRELCVVPDAARAALPPGWSASERVAAGTCLVRYADPSTRPWVTPDHPHGDVWYAALRAALAEGFVSRELLVEEVARGHVSPDLPRGIAQPPGRRHALLRAGWAPPFTARRAGDPGRLEEARARVRQSRAWRRLTSPPEPPRAYGEQLAAAPELREFPFRREEAKPGLEALRARLEAERGCYALDDDPAPLVRLVVLHRGAPGAALERTLRTWELQSCPRRDALVLARDGDGERLRRAAGARAGALPVVVGEAVTAGLDDDAFVVFARPGDAAHPSLATTIDRVARAPGADLVAWHTQTPAAAGAWTLRTSPERAPLSSLTAPLPPRAFALRARWARRYPGDLARAAEVAGGQALLAWASLQEGLRWATHPEFLTAAGADRREPEGADPAAVVGEITRLVEGRTGLTCAPGGGDLPWRVTAVPRAAVASVVVLFRDDLERTRAALSSALDQRTRAPCELVLVAHRTRPAVRRELEASLAARGVDGTRVRWVPYEGPFNHSLQCDLGARAATGDVLVFLSNDARLLENATLQGLVDWALVPGVGTVGCRHLGRDGRLVAAGVRVLAARPRPWSPPVEESRAPELAEVVRETVANSFACAAVARATYDAHGPLDARWFPAGYNDVEYGLRLRRAGLHNVYLGHLTCEHEPGGSRPSTDELPQILELWRRYPELSQLGRCQLGVSTASAAEPLARAARERLRLRLPAAVRGVASRLRRGWT